jgi:DNA-binding response OmpR family regulator
MDERLHRVLILDTDPDTLIKLQHVLEQAEIDATITWDEAEALQLLETTPFDLILIGDHPPELDAAAILDALSFRGTCPSALILRAVMSEENADYFRRLGAIGVVLKRDSLAVLDQVTKALAPMQFKARSAKAGLVEARSLRAAS